MSVAEKAKKADVFTPEQQKKLEAWTKAYPYPLMGLIPAMRDVQEWQRHISPESERYLADLFKVTLTRVHELATFYPYFTLEPTGKYRIGVCRNLSCALAGCDKTVATLREKLGVDEGEVTKDGLFSYEEVECLGACDFAPAISVNDEMIGAGTNATIDRVLSHCKSGAPAREMSVQPGPVAFGKTDKARLLTAHFDDKDLHRLENYRAYGGYSAWEKAKKMEPAAITEEVKKSNVRGLGGAGFPVGMKWSTVPPKSQRQAPHYLVANADESEPGCFKDRALMERNPHALIEGLLIAARAVEADYVFIFLRGEYQLSKRVLEAAISEAKQAELLDRQIHIMLGANAYISGCDTALLETMEGKKAWPRQPPPFPTVAGLMGSPTVVNNVETLMMVPALLNAGADVFAKLGAPKSGGTAVFSVSGHVEKPGVYEYPMGTPFPEILAAAGGVKGGKKLKALIPGGTSTPILTAEEAMKVQMDFDGLRAFGSFLGAGGVIVLDETTDIPSTFHIIERFLQHESCGQCTPCREGSGWTTRILRRILDGEGTKEDLDNLTRVGENILGKVICALGDTVGAVIAVAVKKFRPEFEAKIKKAESRG